MVSSLPGVTYFKPAGIPLRFLNEVCISVEELEALRLKDAEGLEQIEAAARMGVSRATFQRVLSSARKKVAEALLGGKAMRIEGGSFKLIGAPTGCRRGGDAVPGDESPVPTFPRPCGSPKCRREKSDKSLEGENI